jgi:hypothetical protein
MLTLTTGIMFDEDGIIDSVKVTLLSKQKYERDSSCFVRQFDGLVDEKTGAKVSLLQDYNVQNERTREWKLP